MYLKLINLICLNMSVRAFIGNQMSMIFDNYKNNLLNLTLSFESIK